MPARSLHIFKAGRHTAMNGEQHYFSDADLRLTAEAYNSHRRENARLVMGHEKRRGEGHGLGEVLGLVAAGANLHAVVDVTPEAVEGVRKGHILACSAAFAAPMSSDNPVPGTYWLKHVALLGAEPPAVKGMEWPMFADRSGHLVETVARSVQAGGRFVGVDLEFSEGWLAQADLHESGFVGVLAALQAVPGLGFNESVALASRFAGR